MNRFSDSQIAKALIVTGIAFSIVVWTCTVSMAIGLSHLQLAGSFSRQFNSIANSPFSYQIGYFFASLIGPLNAALMIIFTFFIKTSKTTKVLNIISAAFLLIYLILVTVAYTSQYTVFIDLIKTNSSEAEQWYFGNFNSICKIVNQTGYLFFALSGILSGYRFCYEKGVKRFFGVYLELRCAFYTIAFFGLLFNSQTINLLTLGGLFLTLFFGFFAIVIGRHLLKEVH